MGPRCHRKCPEADTDRRHYDPGDRDWMTQPQAKGCLRPPEEARDAPPASARSQTSGLQNGGRMNLCVLRHSICGHLIQQPQEMNTVRKPGCKPKGVWHGPLGPLRGNKAGFQKKTQGPGDPALRQPRLQKSTPPADQQRERAKAEGGSPMGLSSGLC